MHGTAANAADVKKDIVGKWKATKVAEGTLPEGSIVDNNFFHHYLILLYRVKAADQILPIFVPQDMQVGIARVKAGANRTYSIEVGSVKLDATVDESGRLLRLAVPASKVVVER